MNPYESPPQALTLEQLRSVPPEVEMEYEVTFADLIAFTREDLNRQRGWIDLWIVLVLATIALMDLWPARQMLWRDPRMLLETFLLTRLIALLLTGVIVAGLWRLAQWLGLIRWLLAAITYATALVVGRGKMVGLFRCRANHRQITEYTASKPYTFPIGRVRNIRVTPEHIGMRVNLFYIVVIPRRAFVTPQAVDAFVAALEAYTGTPAEYLQPRKSS